MVRPRCAWLALWTLVTLVGSTTPALGQDPPPIVLFPGEARDKIPAAGKVLQVQGNQFADFRSWADVKFERADEQSQNIKLEARHPVREFQVFGTAIARGMLFLDFCVPTSVAVSGCGTESGTPEYINAVLSFGYGIVGHLGAFGFTSEATLDVTASVLDRLEQSFIHVQDLKNLSVRAKNVSVKDVPIPIPDLADATITRAVTFSLTLKRGRVYRFQLAARVSTTKGIFQPIGFPHFAVADFTGPTPGATNPVDGFVQLRNLTISVSLDSLSIQDLISSLQEQLARLASQIDELRTGHREDLAALHAEVAELRLATIGPGPGTCTGAAPGTGWVCVAGSWVPPGHPLAGGVGAVPPEPPVAPPPVAACPGVAPAAGWVCVNGGWVPPDHPLAGGGG